MSIALRKKLIGLFYGYGINLLYAGLILYVFSLHPSINSVQVSLIVFLPMLLTLILSFFILKRDKKKEGNFAMTITWLALAHIPSLMGFILALYVMQQAV